MAWGRYVDSQMYEATLEDDARDIYFKNKAIRESVLRRLLASEGELPFGLRRRKTNTVVPYRTRPPMADDPDDPLGLYDKSAPLPAPKGRFKDPRTLWDQLNG